MPIHRKCEDLLPLPHNCPGKKEKVRSVFDVSTFVGGDFLFLHFDCLR